MDNKHLTFIDEEGNEILCEILFTFDSDLFKKSYVLFYPVSESNEDNIEVMAAAYDPGREDADELFPIETDEEWELIETVLKQYEEDNTSDEDEEEDEDDEEYDDSDDEEYDDSDDDDEYDDSDDDEEYDDSDDDEEYEDIFGFPDDDDYFGSDDDEYDDDDEE